MFTVVNYNHYSPPRNFCFDDNCWNYDPIRYDPKLDSYKESLWDTFLPCIYGKAISS